jgi:hypothetical protein
METQQGGLAEGEAPALRKGELLGGLTETAALVSFPILTTRH